MRAKSLVRVSLAVSFGVLAACATASGCSDTATSGADASAGNDAATGARDAEAARDATATDAALPGDSAVPRDGAADAADGSVQDAAIVDAADAAPAPMVLTSATLTDNGRFPAAHTCNGANRSPALAWTAGPPGTASYAIVMKDLTVPNQHWTLYDIPATTLAVAAAVPTGYTVATPAGAKQGPVTFSPATFGYLGPCPPTNDHDYVFTVYALSGATVAGAAQTDTPEVLETKIRAQKVDVSAEASLRSKYKQP